MFQPCFIIEGIIDVQIHLSMSSPNTITVETTNTKAVPTKEGSTGTFSEAVAIVKKDFEEAKVKIDEALTKAKAGAGHLKEDMEHKASCSNTSSSCNPPPPPAPAAPQ